MLGQGHHFVKLFHKNNFFISNDFPINLVYFCRRFLIESNFPFILLETSSLLDFNEDASRESAVASTTAASKSFSKVLISTAGLLPVHQDPAASSAIAIIEFQPCPGSR